MARGDRRWSEEGVGNGDLGGAPASAPAARPHRLARGLRPARESWWWRNEDGARHTAAERRRGGASALPKEAKGGCGLRASLRVRIVISFRGSGADAIMISPRRSLMMILPGRYQAKKCWLETRLRGRPLKKAAVGKSRASSALQFDHRAHVEAPLAELSSSRSWRPLTTCTRTARASWSRMFQQSVGITPSREEPAP